MFDKMAIALCCGYLKAKSKIKEVLESEDGMETLEAVIMIAVAVILVGFIINFLTKDGFETADGQSVGLIQYLFDKIKTAIESVFET